MVSALHLSRKCPEGPGPGFVGCSHSTVHLLLFQGTKPSQDLLSVQRLVSDSTTLLNPALNNSQITCANADAASRFV
jgi:hypothetical protein